MGIVQKLISGELFGKKLSRLSLSRGYALDSESSEKTASSRMLSELLSAGSQRSVDSLARKPGKETPTNEVGEEIGEKRNSLKDPEATNYPAGFGIVSSIDASEEKYKLPARSPILRPKPEFADEGTGAGSTNQAVQVTDAVQLDQMFAELRLRVYEKLDQKEKSLQATRSGSGRGSIGGVYREFGKLPGERSYFFVKGFGSLGWLFERSGSGWVVSRAEKIIGRNLFIRKGEAWDFVSVLSSQANEDIRILSKQLSAGPLSSEVYLSRLWSGLSL